VLDVGWAAYLTCYPSGSSASSAGETSGEETQESGTQQQTSGTQQQTSGTQQQTSGNQGRTSGDQGQTSANAGQTSANAGQTSGNAAQTSGSTGQTSESTSQTPAKVNINTVSDIVLAALLGGGDEAERTAQAIMSYRDTLAEGIEDISELTEQGVLSNDIFSQIEDYITTRSDIFTIRCIATADRNGVSGTTLHTEAVVDRSSKPCRILFWYQETIN